MKISYNRNSMFAAVKFLREHNPTASMYTELELVNCIESYMLDVAKSKDIWSLGTMGFTVTLDDRDDAYSYHFSIDVDPAIGQGYLHQEIEF